MQKSELVKENEWLRQIIKNTTVLVVFNYFKGKNKAVPSLKRMEGSYKQTYTKVRTDYALKHFPHIFVKEEKLLEDK